MTIMHPPKVGPMKEVDDASLRALAEAASPRAWPHFSTASPAPMTPPIGRRPDSFMERLNKDVDDIVKRCGKRTYASSDAAMELSSDEEPSDADTIDTENCKSDSEADTDLYSLGDFIAPEGHVTAAPVNSDVFEKAEEDFRELADTLLQCQHTLAKLRLRFKRIKRGTA